MRSRRRVTEAELAARERALAAVDLFAEAAAEDLRTLAAATTERDVAAGTAVVREGYLPTDMYLVVDGEFEVVSTGESGEPKVVNVLGPGDHFGEIGLIEGMPATATVRAKTPARVHEIAGEAFLGYVDRTASVTDVADRIAHWLARTHPSYRPSVASGSGTPAELTRLFQRLDPAERDDLLAALRRLASLPAEQRREQLRRLGS